MMGSGFYVNYSVAGSHVWQQTREIQLPFRSVFLQNLKPKTTYEIYLTAVDGIFKTPSEVEIFSTVFSQFSNRTAILGENVRNPVAANLANITWIIAVASAVVVALVVLGIVCFCTRTRGGKYPGKILNQKFLNQKNFHQNFQKSKKFSVKKKEMERGHHLDPEEERSFLEYQYGATSSNASDHGT